MVNFPVYQGAPIQTPLAKGPIPTPPFAKGGRGGFAFVSKANPQAVYPLMILGSSIW
jgi:hypothetical protein